MLEVADEACNEKLGNKKRGKKKLTGSRCGCGKKREGGLSITRIEGCPLVLAGPVKIDRSCQQNDRSCHRPI